MHFTTAIAVTLISIYRIGTVPRWSKLLQLRKWPVRLPWALVIVIWNNVNMCGQEGHMIGGAVYMHNQNTAGIRLKPATDVCHTCCTSLVLSDPLTLFTTSTYRSRSRTGTDLPVFCSLCRTLTAC